MEWQLAREHFKNTSSKLESRLNLLIITDRL